MKSDIEIVKDKDRIRPEKSEVFRLVCDNSLIKELTDYKPQVSIEEGLKKIGFSNIEIEGILGNNWYNFYKTI